MRKIALIIYHYFEEKAIKNEPKNSKNKKIFTKIKKILAKCVEIVYN